MPDLIKQLPLGIQNFHELREDDFFYVDKTSFIYELVKPKKGFYFLSRPRRFGKTLLLSTFESLFKYGLKDFNDLAIEKLWTDDKTYPVIRLDFSQLCSDLSDLKSFQTGFEILLSDALSANNLELPPKKMEGDKLSFRFSRLLEQNSAISPVLLIDEYDAPVNYCLDNQALCKQISNELSSFYAMLKRQSSRFRFMFVTGICKYGTIDIFSSGSFIQDLSLSTK
ncbi:MAG: AAA family ATPase, partial [Succinatimonas sp.]|nr:AAA family ATPase [Succinatimonas sp.]